MRQLQRLTKLKDKGVRRTTSARACLVMISLLVLLLPGILHADEPLGDTDPWIRFHLRPAFGIGGGFDFSGGGGFAFTGQLALEIEFLRYFGIGAGAGFIWARIDDDGVSLARYPLIRCIDLHGYIPLTRNLDLHLLAGYGFTPEPDDPMAIIETGVRWWFVPNFFGEAGLQVDIFGGVLIMPVLSAGFTLPGH